MSEAKGGGSAFPEPLGDVSGRQYAPDPGMSLRDYFAAQALAGILASPKLEVTKPAPELAENCYRIADAMLKAREA